MHGISPSLGAGDVRFEVLPLGKSEEEAAQLPEPVRLTVTCSPKHGPDRSVEVAGRLHAMGHAVTVHIAARMVRDRAHLDELMAGMAQAGSDDLFLIGGDADPLGEFTSAVDLLPLVAEHPQRPRTIGIGGYPEGHPLIDEATLNRALDEKSRYADYITTQLCFDPEALLRWVHGVREREIALPVLVGMPGQVMPAKLLELSARIGVGPSMTFLRKQRGLRNLFGMFRKSAADGLYRALAPMIGDPAYGLGGFHYFTFNQLLATYNWQHEQEERSSGGRVGPARTYVRAEEGQT